MSPRPLVASTQSCNNASEAMSSILSGLPTASSSRMGQCHDADGNDNWMMPTSSPSPMENADGSRNRMDFVTTTEANETHPIDAMTSSALPSSTSSPSCTSKVVTVVEKSILRTLAFVLNQLDREQARYCASSIVQFYVQLQTQLPLFAADSLERFAGSFISLSDEEFTQLWLSLVDEDLENACWSQKCAHFARVKSKSRNKRTPALREDATERAHSGSSFALTLVERLYQCIRLQVQRIFPQHLSDMWHTQTPLTSPDDKYDDFYVGWRDRNLLGEDDRSDGNDGLEPGWAVEYMEQELTVPTAMTRRMQKMMHSAVPLNLFRVKVVYGADDEHGGAISDGFVGVVSPDSFPPTPITRDLQTRRMNRYTVSVLDHATLALRLLQANRES